MTVAPFRMKLLDYDLQSLESKQNTQTKDDFSFLAGQSVRTSECNFKAGPGKQQSI